jgi:hypothetical protein
MEFLKKHYEKVLLGLVLLGLVGGLVVLPFIIKGDNDAVDQITQPLTTPTAKPLADVDLSRENGILQRLGASNQLDLDSTNKLFNPLTWQKSRDGSLIPLRASDYGIPALVVTSIKALIYRVSLVSTETNELGTNYTIQIEHPSAARSNLRRTRLSVSLAEPKKPFFTLTNVVGPPEDPTELDLKMADTGEIAAVGKNKPFEKVDGYTVDLKYPPENNRPFNSLHIGSVISFGGDSYTIVDIKANEVVLSAESNQKRYAKPFSP